MRRNPAVQTARPSKYIATLIQGLRLSSLSRTVVQPIHAVVVADGLERDGIFAATRLLQPVQPTARLPKANPLCLMWSFCLL